MSDGTIRKIGSLVSDLVRIPSVTADSARIAEAATFIRKWMSDNGTSARIVEFKKGSPVIIAEAGRGKRSVLLNGHFDVVPEGDRSGWKEDPYSGKVTAKGVFGRGSADMKAGLAVFMQLVSEIAEMVDYRIIFTAVPDEEVGGFNGSKHLAEKYRPDLVLNAEPSRAELVGLGEKGILQVKLFTEGKVAHASLPSLGRNAIMYMVEDLERLSSISRMKISVPESARKMLDVGIREFGNDVGMVTFNPAIINGGVKTNVVPDRCYAEVDMRLPPGVSAGTALRTVRSLLKHAKIEESIAVDPNYTRSDNPLAVEFVRTLRRHVPGAKAFIKNGGTDGRYFREKGIPTIAFGPGNNRIIHSYNEEVTFKDIETAYKTYRDFLLNL